MEYISDEVLEDDDDDWTLGTPGVEDITEEIYESGFEEEWRVDADTDTEDDQAIAIERSEFLEIVPVDLEDMHDFINDLQGKDQRIFDEMVAEYGGVSAWLELVGFLPDDIEQWFKTEA